MQFVKRMLGLVITLAIAAGAGEMAMERVPPAKAALLKFDREQWQALVAVCATPAFYNSHGAVPLILDDGTGQNTVAIEHDTMTVKEFGGDATAASAKIAMKYWKKAELVFVASGYEQVLWIVPSAAVAGAPILVNPDAATLQALGVKKAVVVGDAKAAATEVVHLADKTAVWKFQLALMAEQNKKCDYVVMTNPHDTDDKLNPNVQWPYLSLSAAPLAAYRQAIVQTGDYTGDRKSLHNLGGTLGDSADKAKYEAIKPVIQKVKDDSYAAEKYLANAGNPPHFLALVGGATELPQYICDIHTKYKFWDLQIDYVPSDTPLGTMRNDVDFSRFVKPDVAVGRIMADDVLDATILLTRTFFRKEWLHGGKYAALAPAGWEKHAVVFDGHRLNQPDEGGPDASPSEPFHPAGEVHGYFAKVGLKNEYVFPRDETKEDTSRPVASDLFASTSAYGFVQYVAHGDPPYLRIEAGRTGRDMKNYLATGAEFRKQLNFKAPTSVYVIGCNVGTIYAPFKSNLEFIPSAAIHAGAVAFMAPNKCQSICFWRYAPKGAGASQCIYFWENALGKKLPVGQALIEAKWQAYEEWKAKQFEADRGKDSDNAIEIDAPSMILYGDPALRLNE
jgi:hypothetical protein